MTTKQTTAQPDPELAAALAQMEEAFQKASQGLPSLEKDWEFVLLGARSELIEQVEKAMAEKGLSRADLARLMDCSRTHITNLLNEAGNFQLETIAKLAVALGRDIAFRLINRSERVVVQPASTGAVVLECVQGFAAQPGGWFEAYRDAQKLTPQSIPADKPRTKAA